MNIKDTFAEIAQKSVQVAQTVNPKLDIETLVLDIVTAVGNLTSTINASRQGFNKNIGRAMLAIEDEPFQKELKGIENPFEVQAFLERVWKERQQQQEQFNIALLAKLVLSLSSAMGMPIEQLVHIMANINNQQVEQLKLDNSLLIELKTQPGNINSTEDTQVDELDQEGLENSPN